MAFRSRSWVFTIFPNMDDDYPWDPDCIDWKAQSPAVSYVVCQLEECPKTNRIHWQGTIELEYPNLLKAVKKALNSDGCHLEKRKGSLQQSIDYCTKSDTRVPDTEPFHWGVPSVVRASKDEVFRTALSCGSYTDAIAHIVQNSPRDYVLQKTTIESNLKKYFHALKGGPRVPEAIKFVRNPIGREILDKMSLFLWGASGLGKTYFALSHFKTPLFVRHVDQLKELSQANDGIIFDDMSFAHWPRTACIHILDVALDSQINVKHSMVSIPAGIARIFTSNYPFREVFNGTDAGHAEWGALERRCKRYRICGSLIDKSNFISNQNVITEVFNE